jgi:very-short-patch-repair endonuclease
LKFRRQRPAGPFIADFFCVEVGLVVEVDGAVHDQPEARGRDALRDKWLGSRQLTVLRLSSALVMADLTAALRTIGETVDRIRSAGEGT